MAMKMTAHPNGMSWTLCYQCVCLFVCVCVFVSSARGQTLSETSWCSGHCWSVGRCVRRISWALKCFRSNHPSLLLSVLYLFSFAFCLHFPLAMDFFLLVYRSLLVSFIPLQHFSSCFHSTWGGFSCKVSKPVNLFWPYLYITVFASIHALFVFQWQVILD